MRIPKLEIRERVIESLAVELDDVGISSLVISVAVVAILLCSIRPAAVEALACRAISRDFLVAVDAKPGLRSSRERLVTFAAILFELGVPLDHRPGHNELLEQILRLRGRRQGACKNRPDQQSQYDTTAH